MRMLPSVENIPMCKIAFIRRFGAYGAGNYKTKEELKRWANENNLMNDNAVLFGIAQDNPFATKPENCRYDACITIPSILRAIDDEKIQLGSLPGGKYAVFEIAHTPEAIAKAWDEIFPTLTSLRFEMDPARPILERYAVELIKKQRCEICVPVL